MKVLVVASAKGGSGKSLVTANIAARLAKRKGERVAMIDLDSTQGTLTKWWEARGRPGAPYLLEDARSLVSDLRTLAADGYTWCVIDTPPLDMKVIEFAVMSADFVVMPVILSTPDIDSSKTIVALCSKRRRKYAYLINSFDSRPTFKKVNADGLAMIPRGAVLKTRLPDSPKFREGWNVGKAGADTDKALAAVLDEVIDEIRAEIAPTKGAAANG